MIIVSPGRRVRSSNGKLLWPGDLLILIRTDRLGGLDSKLLIYWSRREDLNPRPADYKSAALPTELRRRQPERLEAHCMRPGNLPQSIHNSRVVRVYRAVVS